VPAGDGLFLKSDVSKAAEVQSAVQKTVEKHGRLDVAFNNAGVEGVWVPLAEQTEENWDYVHGINLKGVWLCLKYEIQQMLKQGGGGAIVNMSSVAGLSSGSPKAWSAMSVWITAGQTAFTRMLCLAHSAAAVLVNPSTPCLQAIYTPAPGEPTTISAFALCTP
jgi:NAD(P)-dependent dehydrogenase (short-subunit alcohol dehydrogenase family)